MSFMYNQTMNGRGMQAFPSQTFSSPQQQHQLYPGQSFSGPQQQQQQQQQQAYPPMPFIPPMMPSQDCMQPGMGMGMPNFPIPPQQQQPPMPFVGMVPQQQPQQPSMQFNGMVPQQQPSMQFGGMTSQQQPSMQFNGMVPQQQPQQPSMQFNGMIPQQPQPQQQSPMPFVGMVPQQQPPPMSFSGMASQQQPQQPQQQQPSPMPFGGMPYMPQQNATPGVGPVYNEDAGEDAAWIDRCYAEKEDGYYSSLDDAMKDAEFLVDKFPNGVKNYLPEMMAELTSDINTTKFIEAHNMTLSEARAVVAYTYDFGPENMNLNPYYNVNKFLYSKESANVDKYLCFVIHLLRGMRKLEIPNIAVLYRAVKDGFNFDATSVGKEYTWDSFTSTTANENVVRDFAKGGKNPVIFEIHGPFRGYSVRELSTSPEEDEIIIEPGARYRVKSVVDEPGVPNGKRVSVQIVPTKPVLEVAARFFADKEAQERYHIEFAEVKDFRPRSLWMANAPWNVDINVLRQCRDIDDAISIFVGKAWYPEFFYQALMSNFEIAKLNILAASFTRMFMPTLSEIKDGVAATKTYGVFQYMSQAAGTIGLPEPLCGISTKIPEPKDVRFPRRFTQTLVSVGCSDTMEIIKGVHMAHVQQGGGVGGFRSKIACLNMGSQAKPGGDWKKGGASLEELLFMRTTLSASLEEYLYPMKNLECIYTKDVTYIRNGKNEGYRFLAPNERFSFDVVTTCAFNLVKPIYKDNKRVGEEQIPFDEQIEQITYQKVRAILSACASNGADVLILGALGCGAFRNPPDRVSKIFRRAIQEFAGVFSYVYFSIFNDETASIFYNTMSCDCGVPEQGYFKYFPQAQE